jgi:hypothetical protein
VFVAGSASFEITKVESILKVGRPRLLTQRRQFEVFWDLAPSHSVCALTRHLIVRTLGTALLIAPTVPILRVR